MRSAPTIKHRIRHVQHERQSMQNSGRAARPVPVRHARSRQLVITGGLTTVGFFSSTDYDKANHNSRKYNNDNQW